MCEMMQHAICDLRRNVMHYRRASSEPAAGSKVVGAVISDLEGPTLTRG